MSLVRRSPGKPDPVATPPGRAVSTRLSAVMDRRREARLGQQKENYTASKLPVKGKGAVVEIHANETPFSDVLEKARYESRPARAGEYIHVSNLIDNKGCIRKIALMERMEMIVKPQSLSLTDSLTFRQGDAIHDVLKERAARGGPKKMWGNWSCRCGSAHTPAPCLRIEAGDTTCTTCQTSMDHYHEVPMKDAELKIVGTPDVILYLPTFDAFHVTELKSMAHDKWKELSRPIPEHVIQSLFYWFLMNRKGYKLTSRVSLLYATKGWMFSDSPIKEFTFHAPTELRRLDPYIDDARALAASRIDGGELPLRTLCSSEQAPAAKKCEVCQVCFKGSHESPTKVSIQAILRSRRLG